MIKKHFKILSVIILLLTLLSNNRVVAQTENDTEINRIESIFSKLEHGIKTGAIKEFSNLLMLETYISLENGESAYYSSNQSFYILKNFLQSYRPISFNFINRNYGKERPFAIGRLVYSKNGIRGESQVFITLKLENENWKISQIIIN